MLQTEALERARNHGMSKRCIGANQARQSTPYRPDSAA